MYAIRSYYADDLRRILVEPLARDQHDVWLDPALQLYRRAAAEVPSLCPALAAFGLGAELGCVRTD